MNARARILERLRRLVSERRPEAPPIPPAAPSVALPEDALPHVATRFQAQGMSVYLAENPVAARLHLVAWLRARGVTHVWGWATVREEVPGLDDALAPLGIAWREDPHAPSPPGSAQTWAGLTGVHGLSLADAALILAETPTTPLGPALLPPLHVAVVSPRHVFPTLEAWWTTFRPQGSVVLIQGLAQVWAWGWPPHAGHLTPRERHLVFILNAPSDEETPPAG